MKHEYFCFLIIIGKAFNYTNFKTKSTFISHIDNSQISHVVKMIRNTKNDMKKQVSGLQ